MVNKLPLSWEFLMAKGAQEMLSGYLTEVLTVDKSTSESLIPQFSAALRFDHGGNPAPTPGREKLKGWKECSPPWSS